MKKCTKCDKPAYHEEYNPKTGRRFLCCKCYVNEGNPPSDWHWGCMKHFTHLQHAKKLKEIIMKTKNKGDYYENKK